MDLLTFVANFGLIVTILSFLSAIEICVVIWRQKSSDGIQSFPLIAGFLCTSLWLHYGLCIQDELMTKINSIGVCCFIFYLLFYYSFTQNKSKINRQLLITVAFLVSIIWAAKESNRREYIAGLVASTFTVVFTASTMTAVVDVISNKCTEKLPFLMILSSFCVSGSWFTYALLTNDTFVLIPNGIGVFIATIQLFLFLIYPKKAAKVKL